MNTVIFAGLIGAVVGAAVTIAGWFVTERLRRTTAEQQWKREQEQAAKDVVRRVLATCYRRALFAPMFPIHQDHEAMFASLSECRADLQRIAAQIDSAEQQRLVAEIISQLDFIERYAPEGYGGDAIERWKPPAGPPAGYSWNTMFEFAQPPVELNIRKQITSEIDAAKTNIIKILKQLSEDVGIPYLLPRTIDPGSEARDPLARELGRNWVMQQGHYSGVEEANHPPDDRIEGLLDPEDST
jgi:hypothetical protein